MVDDTEPVATDEDVARRLKAAHDRIAELEARKPLLIHEKIWLRRWREFVASHGDAQAPVIEPAPKKERRRKPPR